MEMPRTTDQNPPKLTRREALRRLGLAAVCVGAAASGLSLPARRGGSSAIPCDGCGACEPCPYGVAIVHCFGLYNDAARRGALPDPSRRGPGYGRVARRFLADYRNAIGQFARADRCIGCRRCEAQCPRRLPIAAYLRQVEALTERLTVEELRRMGQK